MARFPFFERRVALLACGSFNPPTFMHMRMFERARDYLEQQCDCEVLEGIMSPVGDLYGKSELIPSGHRLRMCQLASRGSTWIRADGWECAQKEWSRTRVVLEHHRQAIQAKHGQDVRLILLCGADFVDSFSRVLPSGEMLWKPEDLAQILTDYGIVCLQRKNGRAAETLAALPLAKTEIENVIIIEDDTFPNDLSSTRLRKAVKLGHSIRYCTVDEVVEYIKENRLFI